MGSVRSSVVLIFIVGIAAGGAGRLIGSAEAVPIGDSNGNAASGNLVKNANFESRAGDQPADFALKGDAELIDVRELTRGGAWCVALEAGKDVRGDAVRKGSISQMIRGIDGKAGRWYRFTVRGLPEENFSVAGDVLDMKVEFFQGESGFDGKIKHLYPVIQQQRKDLSVNGDGRVGGAATWHSYQLDVMLPSPLIDRARITVEFDQGNARSAARSDFVISEVSFKRIDGPAPAAAGDARASEKRPENLIPIGGRFFYKPDSGEKSAPRRFDSTNADRLIYHDSTWSAPFAGSMAAWLRTGDLDLKGNLVLKDQFIADNVVVTFDDTSMIIHTHGLPNHPTGKFPGENPNYIQEKDVTYYIPLYPKENPNHVVTAKDNSNHALPMGAIGIAANGVVFFNPFDADSEDASNIMDYCCGHPAPDNTYHYHKYPICINSPWADEGMEHSPLLGWVFDGFPIYGPYVKVGVLAKDAKGADALNDFNLHTDAERGPHYQVTPGQFPYIIGGFWGTPDPRNVRRGPGGGPGGGAGRGGPPGGPGPRGGRGRGNENTDIP